MTTEAYRIETVDHNAHGSHWATLREPDEALREHLDEMAAALRISRGEATAEDCSRLDWDADNEAWEEIHDRVAEWYLDVATATWDDPYANRPMCRVELVTGTGGPHVEIVGTYNRAGECTCVELHQYWSGHREAYTSDWRACTVFEDFRSAFIYTVE